MAKKWLRVKLKFSADSRTMKTLAFQLSSRINFIQHFYYFFKFYLKTIQILQTKT